MQEEKKQRLIDARALLEGLWPDAFSFSRPMPLMQGILDQLIADSQVRGLSVTREQLKSAVKLYVESYEYVFAMAYEDHRIDLAGQPAGEVSESARIWASVRLGRKKYRLLRKEAEGAAKKSPAFS